MNALDEFRDALLRERDPGKTLRLVDSYLAHAANLGTDFALPAKHENLAAVVKKFAKDLPGWVHFVAKVREDLPHGGAKWDGVHRLYRVVVIRLTQQEFRVRQDLAVAEAVRQGLVASDFESKMQYGRRCAKVWSARRAAYLDGHRKTTASGRLTLDEQSVLLSLFWKSIDAEIAEGVVPKP